MQKFEITGRITIDFSITVEGIDETSAIWNATSKYTEFNTEDIPNDSTYRMENAWIQWFPSDEYFV